MQHAYSDLFKSIKSKNDLTSALLKAKVLLLQFVTKGISQNDADYPLAQDFVSQRSSDTFNRIEEYWKMLLKDKSYSLLVVSDKIYSLVVLVLVERNAQLAPWVIQNTLPVYY
ncbi:hypothetical protein [Parageobacillus thermoglucosidasius]|uniref:Uncharacterized protein n=1 Tax=Parageobacillus thermoglucosidasius TaxID=1426 RepID=A0A1B7KN45_PARTM|nr:hypothetical protein [Parageobacillus thermoglucosidasius]OAT71409.1 hypothetical protein A7K69_15145 [Parageobacillus thermoglucosidasius]